MACAGSSWPRREHWPLEAKLFFPPSYVYCLSFLFPPFLYGLRKLHAVAGPLVRWWTVQGLSRAVYCPTYLHTCIHSLLRITIHCLLDIYEQVSGVER